MKFAGVKGIIDRSGQQLKVREAQFSATLPGAKHDKLGPLGQSRGLCNTWKKSWMWGRCAASHSEIL